MCTRASLKTKTIGSSLGPQQLQIERLGAPPPWVPRGPEISLGVWAGTPGGPSTNSVPTVPPFRGPENAGRLFTPGWVIDHNVSPVPHLHTFDVIDGTRGVSNVTSKVSVAETVVGARPNKLDFSSPGLQKMETSLGVHEGRYGQRSIDRPLTHQTRTAVSREGKRFEVTFTLGGVIGPSFIPVAQ